MAAGLGSNVTIMDINLNRLRHLADIMPANVQTMYSSEYNIRRLIKNHDLIIGAVLIPGAKAPNLITKDMLKEMRPGTVLVDVAVDQGGCFETTKPTTHKDPIYVIDNVVHYSVANMPGAVPYTSTIEDESLKLGLNVIQGDIVYKGVSDAFKMKYHNVEKYL